MSTRLSLSNEGLTVRLLEDTDYDLLAALQLDDCTRGVSYKTIKACDWHLREVLELTSTVAIRLPDAYLPSVVVSSKLKHYMLDDDLIVIFKGTRWNGASGPTLDPECSRLGTLVHDCLYHGVGAGLAISRQEADRAFLSCLIAAGMVLPRAYLWYGAVRLFGGLWSTYVEN